MTTNNDYFMVIETSDYLNRLEANQFNLFTQKLHNGINKVLNAFKGIILIHNDNTYHVKFSSVSNCILCALKIQANFKYITPKFDMSIRQLKIGITKLNNDDSKKLAIRICEVIKEQIVITNQVKHDYETENKNSVISKDLIRTLSINNQRFITKFMVFIESVWQDSNFSVSDLSIPLNYSNSQIYRKVKFLTGKSPNIFIRDYRLKKAMFLLREKTAYISEIAKETGFKSNTYFSKCFKSRFGILPSKYLQQHT